jgi:hypothetical protein
MSERKSTATEQYAHVLLFACPRCDRPLSATCLSEQRNFEGAEGTWFSLHCHCGWKGDVAGVTAMKHIGWNLGRFAGMPRKAGARRKACTAAIEFASYVEGGKKVVLRTTKASMASSSVSLMRLLLTNPCTPKRLASATRYAPSCIE